MSNLVSVCIPADLRDKAKEHRINISDVARRALADEIARKETPTKPTG